MADLKISALTAATTPLAGTEVLPIVQSGSTKKVAVSDLTAGRAVAMAGGSFTDNIIQSTAGKGFNFTANTPAAGMTSELLNWYEEGTFNATLTTSGTDFTSVTYTNQSCRYVRVGSLVHVQGRLTTSAVTFGSASGLACIGSLPFSPAASSAGGNGRSAINIAFVNGWGTNTPVSGILVDSVSKVFLYTKATVNGVSVATNAATGNDVSATTNDITFSMQYVCS